jgi:serine/threonine protein kinase
MASRNDHEAESAPPTGEAEATAQSLLASSLGSGLLAQQPTPVGEEAVAVAKVCPQCGGEYETGDRFCPKDGTPLRPKAGDDPFIGRVIADRYLILARLGEGGMGRVYLAEHVKMNRQCAVKVMNAQLVNDQESLQRFAREASSSARILHPNVAAVFDYGEADKVVYLVMEYVDGESLSAILAREGKLEPRRAVEIARQIADGLHAAHELGIVHRDLKPDNVIVARSKAGKEIPKVVDFGIAKAITDAPQDALTRSGLVIGTPEYMSPEQLLGDPVDARADIYSLGCILYQMLTGEQAFAAESREQMIRRRLHEAAPHVRDVLPNLPRRLDTLLVHMLARSPADRLASATEARDALDPARALGGWDRGGISAARPNAGAGKLTPNDPSMQVTIPMAQILTGKKERVSPKRIAIGSLVGSAFLFGGMAVWSMVQDSFDPVDLFKRPNTRHDPPAAVAPIDSSRMKKVGLPILDSSRIRAKAESAAAVTAIAPFMTPLNRLTAAMASGEISAVTSAFPGIKMEQRKTFSEIFEGAGSAHIKATPTYGPPRIFGDSATVAYSVNLYYPDKTGAPQVVPLRYVAQFAKPHGDWELVGLR